jgi:hypothetical protein
MTKSKLNKAASFAMLPMFNEAGFSYAIPDICRTVNVMLNSVISYKTYKEVESMIGLRMESVGVDLVIEQTVMGPFEYLYHASLMMAMYNFTTEE